jgi:hypothetical protein
MLICKVCSSEFEYHGPKGPEYKAVTCSKSCRHKLSGIYASERRVHPLITSSCEICGKEIIGTTNSPTCSRACHGKRLSRLYVGRKLTDEWRENQNKSKTRDKIIRRGHFQCEKCKKVFETNLALRAHRSYCTPVSQSASVSCDICKKSFRSDRGLKIHSHCHNSEWNETRREKIRFKALSRITQTTSKSEVRFFKKLKGFFGENDVIHKFRIDNCSHEYDFFIPSKNLIIEFDGDYWHGNRTNYALTPRMKRQYHLDRSWDEKALGAGYNIKRIWESQSEDFQMETL